MFKAVLLLVGAAAGATGATGWLLGFPDGVDPSSLPQGLPLQQLKDQFQGAVAQGKRQGAATEERLRQELAAYRRGATSGV